MLIGQLSLKGRALRLLSGREHSRVELERKLASHEEEAGQLRAVLDDLQGKDFISDRRAAESVVNRRSSRLGASRIQQELKGKGLDGDLILEVMGQIKATELDRAYAVWQGKFGDLPQTATERGKQVRFLAARGFGGDVIRRVLSGAKAPD